MLNHPLESLKASCIMNSSLHELACVTFRNKSLSFEIDVISNSTRRIKLHLKTTFQKRADRVHSPSNRSLCDANSQRNLCDGELISDGSEIVAAIIAENAFTFANTSHN